MVDFRFCHNVQYWHTHWYTQGQVAVYNSPTLLRAVINQLIANFLINGEIYKGNITKVKRPQLSHKQSYGQARSVTYSLTFISLTNCQV